jgi:ComF family protein
LASQRVDALFCRCLIAFHTQHFGMDIAAHLRKGFNDFLDLVYPPRCGGCGASGSGWWCNACEQRLMLFDAASSAHHLSVASGGPEASKTALLVISAALFAPPLREAIHAFKYDGAPQLAEAFARHMATAWRTSGLSADAIVPVPLHPSRQRERGFNQSERLARQVATLCDIGLMTDALKRIRRTEQQAHLSASARRTNVTGAFVANPERVRNRSIVVVDDVLTTGATLAECAAALGAAGAQRVMALTLARAQS